MSKQIKKIIEIESLDSLIDCKKFYKKEPKYAFIGIRNTPKRNRKGFAEYDINMRAFANIELLPEKLKEKVRKELGELD